jgi:hypothetical protein
MCLTAYPLTRARHRLQSVGRTERKTVGQPVKQAVNAEEGRRSGKVEEGLVGRAEQGCQINNFTSFDFDGDG